MQNDAAAAAGADRASGLKTIRSEDRSIVFPPLLLMAALFVKILSRPISFRTMLSLAPEPAAMPLMPSTIPIVSEALVLFESTPAVAH